MTDTQAPVDEAAVEAATKWITNLHSFCDKPSRNSLARIITDCYEPRLAAERVVRERMVEALKDIGGTRCRHHNENCYCSYCVAHAVIEEAEKLEKQDD